MVYILRTKLFYNLFKSSFTKNVSICGKFLEIMETFWGCISIIKYKALYKRWQKVFLLMKENVLNESLDC